MVYFSQTKQAFYPEDLLDAYRESGTLPKDIVEITEEQYNEFFDKINSGYRVVNVRGAFKVERFSEEQPNNPESERIWRNMELARADIELFKVQDSDPKAVGSVSEWRQYRKELRAWSEHEGFPSKANRPKAPDAV